MDPTEIVISRIVESIDSLEDLEQLEKLLNFDYTERLSNLGKMLENMEFSKLLDIYSRRMIGIK